MSTNQDIKKVLDSSAGAPLKDYLTDKLNELKSIDSIIEKDIATQQALEVKSQKRAYNKLKEIMEEIMTVQADVKPEDPRDSFNIE